MKRSYGLLLLGTTLMGMEEGASFAPFASTNTVGGVPITPETILGIASPAPAEVREFVQAWLRMNPEVAQAIAGVELTQGDNPILGQDDAGRETYYNRTQQALKDAGVENLSKSTNVVIALDDVVVKGASFPNRRENINSLLGKPYGTRQLSPEQLQEFNDRGGHTYQGISRVAMAERGREACELFNLARVKFLKKYLVQIPGRPAEPVSDMNYAVVEARVRDVINSLCDNPAAALDPELIRQITMAVGYTGLWNLVGSDGNIFVKKDLLTGQLFVVMHDTELPNNRSPEDFFHKSAQLHVANVGHGWESLKNEIIKPMADKLRKALDGADMLDDQRAFLKALVDEREAEVLRVTKETQEKISAHFAQ